MSVKRVGTNGNKGGIHMFGYIILIIAVHLIIGFVIGKMMENAAADKGYGTEAHTFAMCFWLGIIGCIYVAALPDKIQQKQNQKIIELLTHPEDKPSNGKSDSPAPKHLFRCDKCGKMIEAFPCLHCGYDVEKADAKADKEHTQCPHCKGRIYIPEGTVMAKCPWCKKDIGV